MALVSPGVQVSVTDESFYTPAEPGTTPVIFCATAQDKTNASGNGTAAGTLKANAGKPYLLTSQRDLAETFGDPSFQIDANNNPINGSELSEYGLQAAYSFLGVSNRAWVVRADVDLDALAPRSSVPRANPAAGTYWFDTTSSLYGIQQWNGDTITINGGQTFSNKVPLVITSSANTKNYDANTGANDGPLDSIGQIGDYAVVAVNTTNKVWYRNSEGTWVEIGTSAWKASWPVVVSNNADTSLPEANFNINDELIEVTSGDGFTQVVEEINNNNTLATAGITAAVVNERLEIYSTGVAVLIEGDSTAQEPNVMTDAIGIVPETYYAPSLQISRHTQIPEFKETDSQPRPTGSIWLKTTTPNLGMNVVVKLWNDDTKLWETKDAPVYPTAESALLGLDRTGGGENLAIGTLYVDTNVANDSDPLANFKTYRRDAAGATTIRSNVISNQFETGQTYNLTIQATSPGSAEFNNSSSGTVEWIGTGTANDAITIASAITNAGIPNVSAEVDATNRIVIKHRIGGEMILTDGDDGSITLDDRRSLDKLGISPYVSANSGTKYVSLEPGTTTNTTPLQYRASNWAALVVTPSAVAPTTTAEDGTLWYNSIVDEVDIMIHNGTTWVGYQYDGSGALAYGPAAPYYSSIDSEKTDPAGPIVGATQPSRQSDGTNLANGDLWIDTSDLENYPMIYRYRTATGKWELLDKTDQTTENGILFADARWSNSGSASDAGVITELLDSTYLDPDAPDPDLYPKGMILFNTRRSGFNVKRFVKNHIDTGARNNRLEVSEPMSGYNADRWVTESANQIDGSGSFGRKAQRKVIVQAMQAVINNNDEVRDDAARIFNLISAPGYPELIGEMVGLNYDRGLTGFVIGDSPARLQPNATALNEWATNVRRAVEDNDNGLVTSDEYLGVFYPWGFTSDNFGNNVVVPPSHMMLRTIALSDQVSYPWFAPAGTRRGGINNASATGYLNNEGEFVSIALNEGQRDTLYAQGVNPITFITGAGLVNFGQKTRARGASALDRINVARLVVYLRNQLNTLSKPYLFEPNDKITRDEIKQQIESLMLELVGQRALYDFLVVCDESNNTPARIDRNELHVDIAIEPVKSIEFIYIPLRLKNTGEIGQLG